MNDRNSARGASSDAALQAFASHPIRPTERGHTTRPPELDMQRLHAMSRQMGTIWGKGMGMLNLSSLWRARVPEHVEWIPMTSDYLASRPHLLAAEDVPSFLAGSALDAPFVHDVDSSASIVSFFDKGPRPISEPGSHISDTYGKVIWSSEHGGWGGMAAPDQRVNLAIAPRNAARFEEHIAYEAVTAFVDARLGANLGGSRRTTADGLDILGIDAIITGAGSENAWALPRDPSIVRVIHNGSRPFVVAEDSGSWAWRSRHELRDGAKLLGFGGVVTAGLVGVQTLFGSAE